MCRARSFVVLAAGLGGLLLGVEGCGGGGGGDTIPPASTTHAISGTVSGATSDGVVVSLGGAATSTTTTTGSGLYSFAGLADGVYSLTPSKAGYTFTPPSIQVTLGQADSTDQNFTAAAAAGSCIMRITGNANYDSVWGTLACTVQAQYSSADGTSTVVISSTSGLYDPVSAKVTVHLNGQLLPRQYFSLDGTTVGYSAYVARSGSVLWDGPGAWNITFTSVALDQAQYTLHGLLLLNLYGGIHADTVERIQVDF